MFSVCVCVFLGSLCLKLLLRDDFESLKCWLDLWLSCMLDCIHICVFPFLKNGFLSNLNTSSIPHRHLAICRTLKLFLIAISTNPQHSTARWTDWESSWTLDSSSIASGSIKLLLLCRCFVPRHLLDSCIYRRCFSRQLHLLMLFFLTPPSTDGLTPLDTSICRELLRIYIYALRDPVLVSSISLDLSAPIHLPNILSFTSNLFLKHFSRLIKFFFTW